jgi:hypothetical protein
LPMFDVVWLSSMKSPYSSRNAPLFFGRSPIGLLSMPRKASGTAGLVLAVTYWDIDACLPLFHIGAASPESGTVGCLFCFGSTRQKKYTTQACFREGSVYVPAPLAALTYWARLQFRSAHGEGDRRWRSGWES